MERNYEVFRARVVSVESPDVNALDKKDIYIQAIDETDPEKTYLALPPIFIPTSAFGSGVVSGGFHQLPAPVANVLPAPPISWIPNPPVNETRAVPIPPAGWSSVNVSTCMPQ